MWAVMGLAYGEVDRICELIPLELKITLKQALEREPELKDLAATDARIAQLMETSQALEGLLAPRVRSTPRAL